MPIPGFAKRLIATIEAVGVSQREVARRAGMTHTALHAATKVDGDPRAETVLRIADAFDVSIEWLMRGELPMFRGRGNEALIHEARASVFREMAEAAAARARRPKIPALSRPALPQARVVPDRQPSGTRTKKQEASSNQKARRKKM